MTFERNSPARCYMTPPTSWKSSRPLRSPTMHFSERKKSPASSVQKDDLFHVIHKVPAGDSPYVKAKQVQLVDKDPGKAISLFWAAINAGDRVESALKDMALVMKQLNRSDEAIEAIKSFRRLCPSDSQESLDNILVELYKRSGRVDEEIDMLHHKLKQIEDGMTFVGRSTKQARSQGKKIQITAEQEISRILGNLAWAYLQKGDYKTAEEHYRKALSFEVDRNKQCNLAICLMQMNKITEARFLLQAVTAATKNRKMDDSFVKSFERATQMLQEMEATSDPVKEKSDKFKESQKISGRSMSQYSTPISENSSEKNTDMVKSRTENNWSLTSDAKESYHSHARRRLYETPDPARADPKVPYTKPKKSSWGFNNNGYQRETWGENHSDSKPSFVNSPNEKVPYIIKPNSYSTQNEFFPNANANWRTRTLEDDTSIVKYGPTTTIQQGNTTTVFGSGSIRTLNTEAAMNFTNIDNNKSDTNFHDMVVNGANENFSASVDTTDQNQDKKPVQKKSWADMVEEEQTEEYDYEFFNSIGFTNFDGLDHGPQVFNNENDNTNIVYQPECLNQKLELLNSNDGYNAAPVNDIFSRNPTVRRSLFMNPERDLFFGGEKRRVRLQVFQDITPS